MKASNPISPPPAQSKPLLQIYLHHLSPSTIYLPYQRQQTSHNPNYTFSTPTHSLSQPLPLHLAVVSSLQSLVASTTRYTELPQVKRSRPARITDSDHSSPWERKYTSSLLDIWARIQWYLSDHYLCSSCVCPRCDNTLLPDVQEQRWR